MKRKHAHPTHIKLRTSHTSHTSHEIDEARAVLSACRCFCGGGDGGGGSSVIVVMVEVEVARMTMRWSVTKYEKSTENNDHDTIQY